MKKIHPVLLAGISLSILAAPAAFAQDDYSDTQSEWQDIQRDRAQIRADARKAEEERDELENARREQQRSWWNGDYWGAHRAAEHAREEAGELRAAHQKLDSDVSDVQRDRDELYGDEHRHWYWWGRRWFGGDED